MAKKKVEITEFVNPFDKGVNYKTFLDAIPEGVSVEEYCEGKLTAEQIEWLVNDLKHFKNK